MTKNCMVDNVESAREEDSLQFALSEEDRLLQNFRKKELLFKILVIGDFGVGKLLVLLYEHLRVWQQMVICCVKSYLFQVKLP
jgi:hypothetical protein